MELSVKAETDAPEAGLPEVLTTCEAATYLRLSAQTLRRLARAGKVPARRLGGEYRFSRMALDKFFTETQKESAHGLDA
jgi:excisionase family DNA binding protein